MRARTAKMIVAGVMGATLALATPVAAYADSNSNNTTTTSPSNQAEDWLNSENAFVSHRHQIRVNYLQALNAARAAFGAALSRAHGPQARANARAALLSAIANAHAVQSLALAALGTAPLTLGSLDNSEYLLERQAINEDYADAVGAERTTFHIEMAAAANSAQMVAARAALRAGIAEATIERSAELIALGGLPSKHKSPGFTSTVTVVHHES